MDAASAAVMHVSGVAVGADDICASGTIFLDIRVPPSVELQPAAASV